MADDLALLAILTREALLRLGPANGIDGGNLDHVDLVAALRQVLDEAGAEVHLEPKGSRDPRAFTHPVLGPVRLADTTDPRAHVTVAGPE